MLESVLKDFSSFVLFILIEDSKTVIVFIDPIFRDTLNTILREITVEIKNENNCYE